MKKEMQKWLCGVWTLAVFVMLTGCGHEHTWADATCTTPKTCSECGKTEGEVLEHTWVEATCAEPKHCSVCGETEGEALEHTWTEATCAEPKHCSVCGETEGEALEHTWIEANYWEAKTCSECEATEGEPLAPSFVEHGVSVMDVTVGAEYDYVTACFNNESENTVGKLTITDYQVTDTYEGYETLEGYEWHILKEHILYRDENAQNYGVTYAHAVVDYYDADFEKELGEFDEEVYTINYLGEEYTECLNLADSRFNGWIDHENTADIIFACRIPKGYDGVVVCNVNYKHLATNKLSGVLDGDSLVFRLK